MCEETQAYSCRETELGRPSYREAPLGRGWRAGKAATPEGCERRDLPPQAPPGARVPFRRNQTAEEKTCENSDIWGSLRKKPTRHDRSTAQLSRWAAPLRQTGPSIRRSLTDSKRRAKAHQTERTSPGTKETSQTWERRSPGTETEKQPVHLITSRIQRQGNMDGIHEARTRCYLKIKINKKGQSADEK